MYSDMEVAQTPNPAAPSVPCTGCGEPGRHFCGGCGHGPYCGAVCQRKAWSEGHKSVCAQLRGPLSGLKFRWCKGNLLEESTLIKGAGLVKHREDGDRMYMYHSEGAPPLKSGPIVTDCALFIQTLAILTQKDPKRRVFGVGRLSPWVSLSYSSHGNDNLVLPGKFDKPETLRVHYLSYANETVREMLLGVTQCAGQWIAGPDSQGKYLGMSQEGPRRRSIDDWFDLLVKGLVSEWQKASGPNREYLDDIVPVLLSYNKASKGAGLSCWILGTSPMRMLK